MSYAESKPLDFTPVWDQSVDARATFLVKTYAHLFGAIAAFVLLEVGIFSSGLAPRIATALGGVNWLFVLGAFMIVGWLASSVSHSARSLPAQYAALAAFVAAEAIIFVPLLYAAQRFGNVIESAAFVTLLGFTGLTAVVFLTRRDFSMLRGFLMFGGVIAIALIAGGVLFGFQLGVFFSVAMIAFAGAAVLYDTSNVLHHYPHDRYVGASLQLFASVALMFWYVLRVFMSSSSRN